MMGEKMKLEHKTKSLSCGLFIERQNMKIK